MSSYYRLDKLSKGKRALVICIETLLIIALIMVGKVSASVSLPPMTLTIVGPDGTEVVLNEIDIGNLTSYRAYGGYRTSYPSLKGLGNYTGVPINTFCDLVGGIHTNEILRVTAVDNYSRTFTYAQVNGDFATYNATGSQVPHYQPLTTILAYHFNDENLTSGGPLRFAVVGQEGLITDSKYWVQGVVKLEILGPYYELTVNSSPIAGISFTINGTPQTTPYSESSLEDSYTLVMPETLNDYVWSHWLEDGDPNRTKMIILIGSTTWTGVFEFAVSPYGPIAEFATTPETANIDESVKFDALASQPGWNGTHERPITEYRWDFGDDNKTTTSTPIVYHSFTSSGNYCVELTVYALGATPEIDAVTCKVTVVSIPVGGYSIPINAYTTAKPLMSYFLITAILASIFVTVGRRKIRRKKD